MELLEKSLKGWYMAKVCRVETTSTDIDDGVVFGLNNFINVIDWLILWANLADVNQRSPFDVGVGGTVVLEVGMMGVTP